MVRVKSAMSLMPGGMLALSLVLVVWLDLPEYGLGPTDGSLRRDIAQLSLAASALALLSLPFELLGARVSAGVRMGLSAFLRDWTRAALVQGVVWVVVGVVTLRVGRWLDIAGATGVTVMVAVVLLRLQPWLSHAVGLQFRDRYDPLAAVRSALGGSGPRMVLVDAAGVPFEGGWAGLPGREVLLVPRGWLGNGVEPIVGKVRALRAQRRVRGVTHALALVLLGATFWSVAWWVTQDVSTPVGLVCVHAVSGAVWWLAVALAPSFVGRLGAGGAEAWEDALGVMTVAAGGPLSRLLPSVLGRPRLVFSGRSVA